MALESPLAGMDPLEFDRLRDCGLEDSASASLLATPDLVVGIGKVKVVSGEKKKVGRLVILTPSTGRLLPFIQYCVSSHNVSM